MDLRFEHLAEMPLDERKEFLRTLAADEEFRREYGRWLAVSERIRRDQQELLGDRDLLVLAALHRAGMDSVMDDRERARVRESRTPAESAVAERQFLDDILARIAAEAADFEESWRLREGHLLPYPTDTGRREGTRVITRYAWRISAVAAVIAFVGVLLFVARRDASWIDLRVPDGQTETLAWADGSMVRLIGPALVEYSPVDAEHPRPEFFRLSGDAYFDILPADAKFAVETQTAVVTVLGTSFGVRSVPDRTDVVLASGRVSVTSRTALESVCLLSPSQACFVIEDQPPSSPREVNLSEALDWADLFVFRGTAVSEIAAALSTYYDLEVAVDTTLEETEITGTFERSRGIKEILEVLSRTLDARAVETSTGFRLVQGQE